MGDNDNFRFGWQRQVGKAGLTRSGWQVKTNKARSDQKGRIVKIGQRNQINNMKE